jgi:hypothetical protein
MLYVIPFQSGSHGYRSSATARCCKVAAAVGAAGVAGCALIVTLVGTEIHPAAF